MRVIQFEMVAEIACELSTIFSSNQDYQCLRVKLESRFIVLDIYTYVGVIQVKGHRTLRIQTYFTEYDYENRTLNDS